MQKPTLRLDVPLPDDRVFRYQAMQDILHHLVNSPYEEFTQAELATITGADISTVSRSVELLDQLGVLDIDSGKPATIRINHDHLDQADRLSAVPQAEFRPPIRAFLTALQSRIDETPELSQLVGVVLFGSVARGTADRRSDIDLFVLVEGDLTFARRICTQLGRDLGGRTFDGDRYRFEIVAETPDSAASYGQRLREIFDEGMVLEQTDRFRDVRNAVYEATQGEN